MADNDNNQGGAKEEKLIQVPESLLAKIQADMAELERKDANREAEMEGLRALAEGKAVEEGGETKLREKKTFEPKFRTVRLRQYPMMGDITKLGYVIGWTNRGAYQEVDRSGPTPQMTDYIDVIFLGDERNADGKLKAEKVKLLDLLNRGSQVHCKILKTDITPVVTPTGEEIDITVFDPQHGLISTGEKIDGFVTSSKIKYTLQIPGVEKPVEVDGAFVN